MLSLLLVLVQGKGTNTLSAALASLSQRGSEA